MENKRIRLLKVQPKIFNRSQGHVVLPEIKLCGKWVEELGFLVNEKVQIICENGRITITKHDT
jgi:toxic protein SymE